ATLNATDGLERLERPRALWMRIRQHGKGTAEIARGERQLVARERGRSGLQKELAGAHSVSAACEVAAHDRGSESACDRSLGHAFAEPAVHLATLGFFHPEVRHVAHQR